MLQCGPLLGSQEPRGRTICTGHCSRCLSFRVLRKNKLFCKGFQQVFEALLYMVLCQKPPRSPESSSARHATLLQRLNAQCAMYFTRAPALVTSVVACLASNSTAFVAVGGSTLRSSLGRASFSPKHVHPKESSSKRRQQSRPRHIGVQSLHASAEDEEGGGGFKNPYTAFRQWQMDLVRG